MARPRLQLVGFAMMVRAAPGCPRTPERRWPLPGPGVRPPDWRGQRYPRRSVILACTADRWSNDSLVIYSVQGVGDNRQIYKRGRRSGRPLHEASLNIPRPTVGINRRNLCKRQGFPGLFVVLNDPALEDLLALGQNLVQGIVEEIRGVRDLLPDLLEILVP